ncbi:MAG: aminodeoxychorismate lyase [Algicola sp.]|nr:aminodeoxychorismate lyase [Algicola sp.]
MTTTIIYHDKSPTPVPINDRCFNYGDGFFTTILSQNNQILLLDLHLNRLKRAANRLLFEPIDWQQLEKSLQPITTEQPSVVKVLVSRGAGGRGYNSQNLSPFIYITVAEYPAFFPNWRENGISLGVSSVALGLNPLLAGIKHCNRLEQVLIKNAMQSNTDKTCASQEQTFDDVVVCDLNGCVVECSASNIFWRSAKGEWYTPLNDVAGVDGVMKQFIMDNLPELSHTKQVKASLDELFAADSLFICNSLMGIVPVHSLTHNEQSYRFDMTISYGLAVHLQLRLQPQQEQRLK